ncbi:MAG: NapC/NirT family cytochrome c [Coriobacteriia bacterium]|nr:NapC/NirT family cytochrome c [Coriobacteriia bacterium]
MRLRTALMTHPLVTLAILLGVVGAAFASVPAFKASEAPAFCNSCHEMQPFYTAWSAGAHRNTDCVDCHVDPGTWNHVTHKVIAAKELWVHVAGDPKFPGGDVEVPNERCLRCHADITNKVTPSGFSHRQHAGKANCIQCHRETGHKVSISALKKAGILKPGTSDTQGRALSVQTSGSIESTVALHVKVTCTECHDLAKTACATCHQPKHQARGACSTCHRPGPAWAFAHPASTDCVSCHKAPTKHFPGTCATCHSPAAGFKAASFDHVGATACTSCHAAPARHFSGSCTSCHSPSTPFKKTVFRHTSNDCASCHPRPSGHRSGACATCHTNPGSSWAFSHPSSTSCASCHRAPAKHFGSSCSTCHTPRIAFARTVFRHKASMNCGQCHKAPANHYGSTCRTCHTPGKAFASAVFKHSAGLNCATCHKAKHRGYPVSCASCHTRPGSSWAHTHPSSRSCASCHSAPSNHYGTSCASCHSPSRAWSSATFSHPRVQEHTYRSFPCVRCHPNGYSSHYCSCHPGGRPPSD